MEMGRRGRAWLVATILVIAGCGGAEGSSGGGEAESTTTAAPTALDFCRLAFSNFLTNGSDGTAPAETLSSNCETFRRTIGEPKACVGVTPPATTAPARKKPTPDVQPVPTVRPPVSPYEPEPFGAKAQCLDGTVVFTSPPAAACRSHGGVEILF